MIKMNKIFVYSFLLVIFSCKIQPDSNRDYDKFDPDKTYKLQLNPASGSAYSYEIVSESEMILEINGEDVKNINESDIGIEYQIKKDSAGDFLYTMKFKKIKLYTKVRDTEKQMDAANASFTRDPVEKMLGALMSADINAIVNSSGETKSINGYKELGESIMANVAIDDVNARVMLQKQWDKLIGGNLIKKNMDQLFNIFPDSAIHLRDTWKLTSKQEGEIPMIAKSIYTLKAINNDIAIIEAKGSISSDNSAASISGIGNSTVSELNGEQQGEFEMETQTGMLIGGRIKTIVKGFIHVMGQEIPVKISGSVKIAGKRL